MLQLQKQHKSKKKEKKKTCGKQQEKSNYNNNNKNEQQQYLAGAWELRTCRERLSPSFSPGLSSIFPPCSTPLPTSLPPCPHANPVKFSNCFVVFTNVAKRTKRYKNKCRVKHLSNFSMKWRNKKNTVKTRKNYLKKRQQQQQKQILHASAWFAMCDAIVARAKQGKLQEIVKRDPIGSTLNTRLMGADKCEWNREEERERQWQREPERSVDAPEGKSKIDKHFNLTQLKWQRQRQLQQLLIWNTLLKFTI